MKKKPLSKHAENNVNACFAKRINIMLVGFICLILLKQTWYS